MFIDRSLTKRAQALWLHQGYRLEFLGLSSFVPGLYLAGLLFFAVNVWILGIIVQDVGGAKPIVANSGIDETAREKKKTR